MWKATVTSLSYHSLSKASENEATEQLPCRKVPKLRSLLDEGFVVSFRALHDLDLCNVDLRLLLGDQQFLALRTAARHTCSAIFSMDPRPPLTSSMVDMMGMSLLERV